MQALVDLTLSLPSSGTRSLMFRFGDSLIGGAVTSADEHDFTPGGEYRKATLDLWVERDQVSIAPGSSFMVWHGKDVGEGTVTALTASA